MPLLIYAVSAWLVGLFTATIWGESTDLRGAIVVVVLGLGTALACRFLFDRAQTSGIVIVVAIAAFVTGSVSAQHKAACMRLMANSATPLVPIAITVSAGISLAMLMKVSTVKK